MCTEISLAQSCPEAAIAQSQAELVAHAVSLSVGELCALNSCFLGSVYLMRASWVWCFRCGFPTVCLHPTQILPSAKMHGPRTGVL